MRTKKIKHNIILKDEFMVLEKYLCFFLVYHQIAEKKEFLEFFISEKKAVKYFFNSLDSIRNSVNNIVNMINKSI